eukprot:gnl/TRDRNA2_/TRDRNA2_84796_c0_seq1.p1 gnl/TRDRNA2_/TRDRNA2_84796_c0~~gnl/TRDRNA2_/TRDRNA2_84796_c0_seq1.p1  ORF type:complete len:622 (+),score=132.40 gnl/TRDRNA2_/TRDRNA2_84796_c0_seq1:172-2037(+)
MPGSAVASDNKQCDKERAGVPSGNGGPNLGEKVLEEVRTGIASSLVAEAVLFPLDTLKLQQQLDGGTMVETFRRVLAMQGARAFYQGINGRLIQTITSNGCFFIWQTIFVTQALRRISSDDGPAQLGTGTSLIVNMLAQMWNRLLTTPVDVVANVNQADPHSKGFISTFAALVQTSGVSTLWRGISVTLILALNPALMFTLVGKLKDIVCMHKGEDALTAAQMFWITGISKFVATLLTYPLIRAKAVMQARGTGLFKTFADIAKKEGRSGLYSGLLIMSYKTVLFNALMMSLKQKLLVAFRKQKELAIRRSKLVDGKWRRCVKVVKGTESPWEAAARGASVAYVDGTWSFLHPAQQHVLAEAAKRTEHLVVGIHGDQTHLDAIGKTPPEGFIVRNTRLLTHRHVDSIIEDAPWDVTEDLIAQLGISKVFSGSILKHESVLDTPASPPAKKSRSAPSTGSSPASAAGDENEDSTRKNGDEDNDPYADCRRLGIFEEISSVDRSTTEAWFKAASFVLFSPPGAAAAETSEVLAAHLKRRAGWDGPRKTTSSSVPPPSMRSTSKGAPNTAKASLRAASVDPSVLVRRRQEANAEAAQCMERRGSDKDVGEAVNSPDRSSRGARS